MLRERERERCCGQSFIDFQSPTHGSLPTSPAHSHLKSAGTGGGRNKSKTGNQQQEPSQCHEFGATGKKLHGCIELTKTSRYCCDCYIATSWRLWFIHNLLALLNSAKKQNQLLWAILNSWLFTMISCWILKPAITNFWISMNINLPECPWSF